MLYTVSVGPLALNMPVYMMQHRRGIIRTVLNGSLGEKKLQSSNVSYGYNSSPVQSKSTTTDTSAIGK